MENTKLKTGEEVTINIPFTYTIGEKGFYTGKVLKTIQDCKDEVLAEIEAGVLSDNEVYMNVDYKNYYTELKDMKYEHYLFSKIWEKRDKSFRKLEYDLQWGFIFVEYDKFLKSKFANLETSLYDCIDLYFANKCLIDTKK